MQIPSSQPVLVLASCGFPARELPPALLDFFRSSAADDERQQKERGIIELSAASPDEKERAIFRGAEIAAHRIAAAGRLVKS